MKSAGDRREIVLPCIAGAPLGGDLPRDNHLQVLAVHHELRIGNGRRWHLEGRLSRRVDRPIGRDQHTQRLLSTADRQARVFDARLVAGDLQLRAQGIEAAADAALVALIRVL